MAGSARTLFTNVLPWAAVAVLGFMFFVQVGARHRAENRAARALDDLHTLRADQVMGPAPADAAPAVPEGAVRVPNAFHQQAQAELDGLRKQVEQRAEELAAAKAAHQAAMANVERSQALLAVESARADALEKQLSGQQGAVDEQVAKLRAELDEATSELARRQSPVARWLALAERGTPEALAVVRAETPEAGADDVQELAARWKMNPPSGGALQVALVVEHMPASTQAALLAADLYLTSQQATDAAKIQARLERHLRHATAVVRVLTQGTNEQREDVIALAAAATDRGWTAEAETRVGAALSQALASDDAWTLEIAIRAFAQLGIKGHEAQLLRFLTHAAPAVRIATVYALLATSDRASAVKILRPTVLGLLAEEEFSVRMAGLFLAQELAGEKRSLAFGSSDQAVAKEIERLKTKLQGLGGD